MPIKTENKPQLDLRKLLTLLFAQPKWGKSTYASQIPNACFIATEPGLNAITAPRWSYEDGTYVPKTWDDFKDAVREVIAGGYTTIIIDHVGNMCMLAEEHVCKKFGAEHKSDGKLGYGVGGDILRGEIKRFLVEIGRLGVGVVLIAHATKTVEKTRAGEILKYAPQIPCDNKTQDLFNAIVGACDIVLFGDQEADGTRVLRTKPHPSYVAGDRFGRLPETVALPQTPNGAGMFAAVYEAFYGKPMPVAKETKPADPAKIETKEAAPAAATK